MTTIPTDIRALIEAGPLAHLATINRDGSPQVSVIWIGLDGDQIVSGHMNHHLKLRNIERDPRVVISFDAPREPGAVMSPYVVLKAHATVARSDDAWSLLDKLAKTYMGPDKTFPAPPGPGYVARYEIDKIGGVGSWAPRQVGDRSG